MTRDEIKQILMVVQAAYPNFNPPDRTVTIDTWLRFLGDYTYQQVDAAVGAYIRSDTSGFAPNIGKIMEKLQVLFQSDEPNEIAAWGIVLKAIWNSGYHAEEEFGKLPPIIQKAVGSPEQLREWAVAGDTNGTWTSVTQSNFMRAYRAVVAREKEIRKLSPEILRLISNVNDKAEISENNFVKLNVSEAREQEGDSGASFTPKVKSMLDDLRTKLMGGVV